MTIFGSRPAEELGQFRRIEEGDDPPSQVTHPRSPLNTDEVDALVTSTIDGAAAAARSLDAEGNPKVGKAALGTLASAFGHITDTAAAGQKVRVALASELGAEKLSDKNAILSSQTITALLKDPGLWDAVGRELPGLLSVVSDPEFQPRVDAAVKKRIDSPGKITSETKLDVLDAVAHNKAARLNLARVTTESRERLGALLKNSKTVSQLFIDQGVFGDAAKNNVIEAMMPVLTEVVRHLDLVSDIANAVERGKITLEEAQTFAGKLSGLLKSDAVKNLLTSGSLTPILAAKLRQEGKSREQAEQTAGQIAQLLTVLTKVNLVGDVSKLTQPQLDALVAAGKKLQAFQQATSAPVEPDKKSILIGRAKGFTDEAKVPSEHVDNIIRLAKELQSVKDGKTSSSKSSESDDDEEMGSRVDLSDEERKAIIELGQKLLKKRQEGFALEMARDPSLSPLLQHVAAPLAAEILRQLSEDARGPIWSGIKRKAIEERLSESTSSSLASTVMKTGFAQAASLIGDVNTRKAFEACARAYDQLQQVPSENKSEKLAAQQSLQGEAAKLVAAGQLGTVIKELATDMKGMPEEAQGELKNFIAKLVVEAVQKELRGKAEVQSESIADLVKTLVDVSLQTGSSRTSGHINGLLRMITSLSPDPTQRFDNFQKLTDIRTKLMSMTTEANHDAVQAKVDAIVAKVMAELSKVSGQTLGTEAAAGLSHVATGAGLAGASRLIADQKSRVALEACINAYEKFQRIEPADQKLVARKELHVEVQQFIAAGQMGTVIKELATGMKEMSSAAQDELKDFIAKLVVEASQKEFKGKVEVEPERITDLVKTLIDVSLETGSTVKPDDINAVLRDITSLDPDPAKLFDNLEKLAEIRDELIEMTTPENRDAVQARVDTIVARVMAELSKVSGQTLGANAAAGLSHVATGAGLAGASRLISHADSQAALEACVNAYEVLEEASTPEEKLTAQQNLQTEAANLVAAGQMGTVIQELAAGMKKMSPEAQTELKDFIATLVVEAAQKELTAAVGKMRESDVDNKIPAGVETLSQTDRENITNLVKTLVDVSLQTGSTVNPEEINAVLKDITSLDPDPKKLFANLKKLTEIREKILKMVQSLPQDQKIQIEPAITLAVSSAINRLSAVAGKPLAESVSTGLSRVVVGSQLLAASRLIADDSSRVALEACVNAYEALEKASAEEKPAKEQALETEVRKLVDAGQLGTVIHELASGMMRMTDDAKNELSKFIATLATELKKSPVNPEDADKKPSASKLDIVTKLRQQVIDAETQSRNSGGYKITSGEVSAEFNRLIGNVTNELGVTLTDKNKNDISSLLTDDKKFAALMKLGKEPGILSALSFFFRHVVFGGISFSTLLRLNDVRKKLQPPVLSPGN